MTQKFSSESSPRCATQITGRGHVILPEGIARLFGPLDKPINGCAPLPQGAERGVKAIHAMICFLASPSLPRLFDLRDNSRQQYILIRTKETNLHRYLLDQTRFRVAKHRFITLLRLGGLHPFRSFLANASCGVRTSSLAL